MAINFYEMNQALLYLVDLGPTPHIAHVATSASQGTGMSGRYCQSFSPLFLLGDPLDRWSIIVTLVTLVPLPLPLPKRYTMKINRKKS